jgi:hypothetical protein
MTWLDDYYIDDMYGDIELDSGGDPLPVCHNCGDIVPEMEIYYTIHGLDYCQHCAQARIDAMSEDERDAWLADPK